MNAKVFGIVFSLFFCVVFFRGGAWPQDVWLTDTVDSPGIFLDGNYSPAIALDQNGRPYVAYGGDHLYMAHYNGTTWVHETVDNSIDADELSMTTDPNGSLHVAYTSQLKLKYATNSSGVWVVDVIASSFSGQYGTAIAVDSMGSVHISYFQGRDLCYTTNASGSWVSGGSLGRILTITAAMPLRLSPLIPLTMFM